jgi:hypothetical protein
VCFLTAFQISSGLARDLYRNLRAKSNKTWLMPIFIDVRENQWAGWDDGMRGIRSI